MSIDELTSAIAANVSQVNEAIAGSQGAGSLAEELSGTFAGLGAESQAATLSAVQSQLAEAAQIGASYVAKLQEAAATAESAKGAGLSGTGGTPIGGAAYAGEPLKAVEEPVSEHRKELASSDDGDNGMSKARRFGRSMARNSGDHQTAGKDVVDSVAGTIKDDYDPQHGNTHTSVGVPSSPPPSVSAVADIKASDYVGTTIVVIALAAEGVSRLLNRKKGHGG